MTLSQPYLSLQRLLGLGPVLGHLPSCCWRGVVASPPRVTTVHPPGGGTTVRPPGPGTFLHPHLAGTSTHPSKVPRITTGSSFHRAARSPGAPTGRPRSSGSWRRPRDTIAARLRWAPCTRRPLCGRQGRKAAGEEVRGGGGAGPARAFAARGTRGGRRAGAACLCAQELLLRASVEEMRCARPSPRGEPPVEVTPAHPQPGRSSRRPPLTS